MNAPLKMSIDALKTARMVENAISNWILKDGNYTDNPQVDHTYSFQDYPKVQSRIFSDFDTSSEQGTFWFFIPIMISFLSLNSELLKEKERKLRQGLMLFGISSLSYIGSWVLFMLIFNLFFSAFMVGIGYVCQFSVFINTPFVLMFFTFYIAMFGFNVISLFMVSSPPKFSLTMLVLSGLQQQIRIQVWIRLHAFFSFPSDLLGSRNDHSVHVYFGGKFCSSSIQKIALVQPKFPFLQCLSEHCSCSW